MSNSFLAVTCQAPLSLNSPCKNTGVGCRLLLQGNLPHPGIESRSPTLQMDSFPLSHQGSPVFSLTTLQTTKEQGPWLSYLLRWLDRAKHACTNRFPLLQIMVMSKLRLESKSSTIQPSCPQYLIVKPHYVQKVLPTLVIHNINTLDIKGLLAISKNEIHP